MTEFGRTHLETWFRIRAGLFALAFLVALLIQVAFRESILLLLVLFLLNLALSISGAKIAARVGAATTVRGLLLFDIATIAVILFLSGGIKAGYAALFMPVVLSALFMLGRRAALQTAVLCIVCFLAQFALDALGIRAFEGSPPLLVEFIGQFALLLTLVGIAVLLATQPSARAAANLMMQLREDKSEAEAERTLAEHAQQQWALVNTVALRIQESTTPDQVYTTIGEELERVALHCAILEWAQPRVSFRVVHSSLGTRLTEVAKRVEIDLPTFEIEVGEGTELARAVATRGPVVIADVIASTMRILPQFPREMTESLLNQVEAKDMVYAPMLNHEEVTGVLLVWGKQLGENDLAPLAALAQQACSALDKARLLTEQRKRAAQLELVSTMTARISSAENVELLFQPLVRDIGERFGYDAVAIALVDEARQELQVAASYTTLSQVDLAQVRQPLADGILGRVARTGEPYLARHTRDDPNFYSPQGEASPIRSEFAVPLRAGAASHLPDKVIGILDVESAEPDAFEASDINAITLLAEQVSTALTKTRLLALEQKHAAQLALVSEIAARAAGFADPDVIMRTMVELVQERFGYPHVCVTLYDAKRNEMEQHPAAGSNAHLSSPGNRWSANQGVIGLAARTRQTVYSGDLTSDPRFSPDPDKAAAMVTAMHAAPHSALCVPFVSGKNVMGVLDVESEAYHAFDANDIGAMETLANQMAAALEKARSLQTERRRAAQMALVNRIASRTARLIPAAQLVREAVQMIRAQFGYYNVAVLMSEDGNPGVRLVANAGGLSPLLGASAHYVTGGIIGYVAKSGSTYLCPLTADDPRYNSPFPSRAEDPVLAELTIPLRRGESIIGVLDIQSDQSGAFNPDDITALEALADQLAAALENARLFESEKERAAQLEAVRLLSLKLTAVRELDPLLESIVSSAADLVQADSVTLDLVDPTHGDLVVHLSENMPKDYVGLRLPIGEGLAGRVAQRGEPLIVSDYTTWEGRLPIYDNVPFAGVMAVPLKWQERVLGVINLHRYSGRPEFTHQELALANLFAAQAAIAMENARLLDALHVRLRAQQALTDSSAMFLNTTEPQFILEHAAATARRALNCESALVLIPDEGMGMEPRSPPVPGSAPLLMARAFAGDISRESEFAQNLPWGVTEPRRAGTETRAVPERGSVTTATDSVAIPAAAAYGSLRPVVWGGENPTAQGASVRRGIAVPMLVGDRAVGVISIYTRLKGAIAGAGDAYELTDVQTLSLLANQTASALERARYFAQVQHRVRELNHLFEGYRATSSTLDPDQVIARVLEQFVRALDVTSVYYIQVDPHKEQLRQTHEYYSEYAHAQERATVTRHWSMEAMPEVREVLARHVRITNASDLNVSAEMRAYMQLHRVFTILRVPLIAADQVVGYFSLWESRAPRTWNPDDVRFVQTLSSQAAAAFVNARLYQAAESRTRELQALHEASRLITSSLDVRAICNDSVDSLRDILGYAHVSIYFIENQNLKLQVQRGYEQVLDDIPLTSGVMARAVNTRQTIFLPDVRQEPGFLAALFNAQSEIAVPLIAGDRVVGVLNVETIRSGAGFDKEILTTADAQLLITFANQLVIAIENARLFQETQQGLAQLRTLHTAGQAINAELDLEAVLEQIAQQFVVALEVELCTLFEYDAAHKELVVLYDFDWSGVVRGDPSRQLYEPRARVNAGERFAITRNPRLPPILESHAPQVYRIDDPQLPPIVRADLERDACSTQLELPLLRRGKVIGLIELGDRKQARDFGPDEIRLAESLASQAAVALENARLYRAAQERVQETVTLYRFARELGGTMDIHRLGKRALEAVGRLVDFDIGEVSLVRESDGALVPLVLTGGGGAEVVMGAIAVGTEPVGTEPGSVPTPTSVAGHAPSLDAILPRGIGIAGWVVEHGRTVRVGDVTRDPRYHAFSLHMMSELCLPLRVGNRVIGVLNLEAKAPNAFDAHAEELLVVFANQLAITIENARLYEQTKRDAEVKAALLRELSHRVKNNLAAITSLLYMALDEPPESREQILGETLGRVQSMALAHALLARSGDAHVNLVDLGRQVLNDTVRNLGKPGRPIHVEAQGDSVQVGARQTTTLALVLNEVATNSMRHGFVGAYDGAAAEGVATGGWSTGERWAATGAWGATDPGSVAPHAPGMVTLRFYVSRRGDEIECLMEDNGGGLPEGFQVEMDSGLGLNLVRTLVEKDLHGQFQLERHAPWTRATIRFQLDEGR